MPKPLLSIVLPTYNEKDNIDPLLNKIESSLSKKDYSYEIIFVDDSSDETPELIKQRINSNPAIRLIHRDKTARTGLATAFLKGFAQANGTYICCMDSDLQHPPEIITKLIQTALTKDADIVVASRYIKGGSAEGLGSLYRKLVSLATKYLTQIIFIPTRLTTDPGSGFFVFKKSILNNTILEPKGFKILIEILMRANYRGNQVFDTPYQFLNRENDTSKATIRQGIEYLKHLIYIIKTVPEAKRLIKFIFVGICGIFLNLGILWMLFNYSSLPIYLAWLTAVLISIFFNLTANTFYTYNDKQSPSRMQSIRRLKIYYGFSLIGISVNFFIFYLGLKLGLHYIVAALFGIIIVASLSFTILTKWVWKK